MRGLLRKIGGGGVMKAERAPGRVPHKTKAVIARPTKGITEKCSVVAREQHQWRQGATVVRRRATIAGQLELFGVQSCN